MRGDSAPILFSKKGSAKMLSFIPSAVWEAVKKQTKQAQASVPKTGSTYNPQTGSGTFEDGTAYEKYTWEPDENDPTKLYRQNVGTGAQIGADYINKPTPIAGGGIAKVDKIDPYEQMMSDYREQIDALKEARKQETLPFDHPDLIKDDSNDNEEIL